MSVKKTSRNSQGFPAEFIEACGKENVADVAMRVFSEWQASVPDYTPEMIAGLRKRLNITQSMMAMLLNTSVSTVQKWEIGAKKPSGAAKRLLQMLDSNGLTQLQRLMQVLSIKGFKLQV